MTGFMSHKRFPYLIVAVLVFLSVLNMSLSAAVVHR